MRNILNKHGALLFGCHLGYTNVTCIYYIVFAYNCKLNH